MDELESGFRDRQGEWRPKTPIDIAPFWRLPVDAGAILRWLPGYFLPWNALFAVYTVVFWVALVPTQATLAVLSPGWVAYLLCLNVVTVFLFYGAFELHLYIRRAQGTRFKYNPAFPGDRKSAFFWFGTQNLDNMARTFLFGVPIWTALEVGVLWAWANGVGPWALWGVHPVWLALLALLVPVIHEAHFYAIHRLIHTPWLYKHVHSVHHRSVNPSPWSSLSMHPVEHLLYFSSVLYHLVLPSHPLIALYQLHFAGFGAIPGHVGFDKVELGERRAMDPHAFAHYLHHKHFEVNYGDGLVPFDHLFGTWHDGSDAAAARMRERLKARRRAERG